MSEVRLIDANALKIEIKKQIAYCEDKSKHQSDMGEVLRYSNTSYGLRLAHNYIDNTPTVEPTFGLFKEMLCAECDKRPKGEWIGDTDFDGTCKCSKCRMTFDTDRLKMVMCDGKYELPPCCPNCGAEMRKEVNNETDN